MNNLPKVIFDTNFLRDIQPHNFLGNREKLKKFEKVAEIIIPDIVIAEIEHQIKRNLSKKKKSFLDNPFHWLKNLNEDETKNFDIEKHILELKNNEDILFTEIEITDYSILEKIKELALQKKPPFENEDKTDKGFKDAYIYFTILEFLQKTEDKDVFVCTRDGKLKEALKKHLNIKIIYDFDDFTNCRLLKYQDNYFIEKLQNEIDGRININSLKELFVNIYGKDLVLIDTDEDKIIIEIESAEIISFEKISNFWHYINSFINSGNFANTHDAILYLIDKINLIPKEEIIKMLRAVIENSQINSIIGDEDVKEFILKIFEPIKDEIEEELKINIENVLK